MNFDEKLIEMVKGYPVLYNKSSSGYKNISVKAQVWKKIGESLVKTDLECSSRWKSLRDKFAREHKLKKQPSGSAAKTKPEWVHYQILYFLKDSIEPRNTIGNYIDTQIDDSIEKEDTNYDDFIDELGNTSSSTTTTTTIPPTKKQKKILIMM